MASLMRRLGSMKRGQTAQVRPPTGESEHSDKGGKYLKCNVAMLDDSYKIFDVEVIICYRLFMVMWKAECCMSSLFPVRT